MEDCIFCKIAGGDIPADIVAEDDEFLAFRDIDPKAPVHVLVIPREHVGSFHGTNGWNSGQAQALLRMIVRVAEDAGIEESGYRVVSNAGPDSGQEVDHLHVHVLGGKPLGRFW